MVLLALLGALAPTARIVVCHALVPDPQSQQDHAHAHGGHGHTHHDTDRPAPEPSCCHHQDDSALAPKAVSVEASHDFAAMLPARQGEAAPRDGVVFQRTPRGGASPPMAFVPLRI